MTDLVTVYMDCDERWPDFLVSRTDRYGYEAQVDASTLERWEAVITAYELVQDEMGAVHDAVAKRPKRA